MIKKILIIGLGGAGQRHLRIIRKNNKKIKIYIIRKINLTPLLDKKFKPKYNSNIEEKFKCKSITEKKALKENFQIIIVSNPTSLHLKSCIKFRNNTNFFLVEKPFTNKFDQAINFLKKYKKNIFFYTGYQKKFDPIWTYYKKNFFKKKEINKIHFKNYSDVRNWHPYENYKTLYACRKKLGGGVILTECHEIQYVHELFGMPKSVKCYQDKKVDNLDVETASTIIMKYKKFSALIELNMMSKKIQRSCEIILNNKVIYLDFNKKVVTLIKNKIKKKIKLKFNNDYNFQKQWIYATNLLKKNKIKKTNFKTLSMIELQKRIHDSKIKNKEIFIR
jgi:predicted dehydrogenase